MKYRTIVVDPPWDQGKTGLRSVRPNQGTVMEYDTLSLEEIASVSIRQWAEDDAVLFLWATASKDKRTKRPILGVAFSLLESWGFKYYTTLVWEKPTGPCPFGPYQITAEFVLVGYRGKLPFVGPMGKRKTVFQAPVTRHSEKPASFYESLLKITPEPRLDVFARQAHPGFDGWGDEYEGRSQHSQAPTPKEATHD